MTSLTRSEKADRYERMATTARRARDQVKSKRKEMTRRVVQGGSAYVGGALFGENYAAAGMLGIGGIGLALAGYESPLTHGMEAVGIGATYMYGAKHPPQMLQGVASAIQGKLSSWGA